MCRKKLFKNTNRIDKTVAEISNRTRVTENYYRKDMDHTISNNNHYYKTNFDYAASTGSIYKNDIFEDCSMYQTDFEFCTFQKCKFSSKRKVVSSFNCSDFIKVDFSDTHFKACTFTGTLFEKCTFQNIDIQSSTLENALFQNCTFMNVDLSRLNTNFMHLVNPKMDKVILPSEQIPYIFGCLKYLLNTDDDVSILTQKGVITVSEYFKNEIPKLIQKWNNQVHYDAKAYFPLANTYIALNDFNEAQQALSNGITSSIAILDYRMIKFYCKLISDTDAFENSQRHLFYNIIKCFAPNTEHSISTQRSFVRNIAEIKSILFSNQKKATLNLKFLTNIHMDDSKILQKIIQHIFSITKMKYKGFSNDVEITLSENSPLLVSLKVTSDEENIYYILNQCIEISKATFANENKSSALQYFESNEICNDTNNLILFCTKNSVQLSISEYFMENILKRRENIPEFFFSKEKMYIE